jgi:hypothetical protein
MNFEPFFANSKRWLRVYLHLNKSPLRLIRTQFVYEEFSEILIRQTLIFFDEDTRQKLTVQDVPDRIITLFA